MKVVILLFCALIVSSQAFFYVKPCSNHMEEGCFHLNKIAPLFRVGNSHPGKRCANLFDESCINGGIPGAPGDDEWLNGGSPGKK